MFQSNNQRGVSPVFALVAIVAMVSLTGITVKYAVDGQKELDDEISRQEDLVSKSNVDIIKKDAVGRSQDSAKEGEMSYSMIKTEKSFLFPEITAFEDENIKTKVNAKLKEEADSFCVCGEIGPLTGCQIDAKVTYSSNYIFSLEMFYNWSCEKELHDSRGFTNLVFDMKNGEIVGFGDIFGAPASSLGPQISDKLAGLIEKNVKNKADCPEVYQKELIKDYSYSYFVTDRGVAFTPELSYAGLMCTEDILIPMAEIKPLAKPNSIMERLITD